MMFTWLKRYADFAGRSSRKEYWLGVLCLLIAYFIAATLDIAAFGWFAVEYTGPLQLVLSLGTIIPSLAMTVRRLHDTDRTGWWVLINLIPLVGIIVLLIFTIQVGQPRANRFGEPPPETPGLEPTVEAVVTP
ncbi:MAG: hypothetical protein BGN86_05975 [Caulobacterales bacterium 68-7]|nr:MAG: hypothetical protein BGN86_05975 [Caulobacterales bacterium 68-7]